MIYLDNAATTQILPEVLDAMLPYFKENFGNAGSMHKLGRQAADAVATARQQVADFIGAKPEQIIFTSGGTEANNMVFAGLQPYLEKQNKKHILTTAIEHDSVLNSVNNLCIKHQFDCTFSLPNSYGEVILADLWEQITEETGLVSVMYVNNETGAAAPVEEIGEICKTYGALFHTDCVQAAETKEIDVNKIGCDFLSLSSHKIHGPKGVGALYVRDTSLLSPIVHGGAMQEYGLRGGTENVAGIVGFGRACEISKRDYKENLKSVKELTAHFMLTLRDELYNRGVDQCFHNGKAKYPKVINLRFQGIDAQSLLLLLDANGICVSSGSACRSQESEPSHVLISMGLTPDEARESVRISVSPYQTVDEMITASKVIAECVEKLYNLNRRGEY